MSLILPPSPAPSKNQNPREGIETFSQTCTSTPFLCNLQKTKIPARGLKQISPLPPQSILRFCLQKTKIPARGLKRNDQITFLDRKRFGLQKTKIPARGLKLGVYGCLSIPFCMLQKTKIPARGLKLWEISFSDALMMGKLQKTKIPARGLKHKPPLCRSRKLKTVASKNQNPREGIET